MLYISLDTSTFTLQFNMPVWEKIQLKKGKPKRETCLYFRQQRYIYTEILREIHDRPYI